MRGTLLDSITGQIHEYCGFFVTYPEDFARGYSHFFSRKPVAGLDDQLANSPTLVIDQKIADVAKQSVVGLEVIAVHRLGAARMRIRTFQLARVGERGEASGAAPPSLERRSCPTTRPLASSRASRNNGDTPLRIVLTLVCASQSKGRPRFVCGSGPRAGLFSVWARGEYSEWGEMSTKRPVSHEPVSATIYRTAQF